PDIMGALSFPEHPWHLAAFGFHALQPASWTVSRFATERGRALWAGMAAHGIQPLSNWTTSAIAIVLSAVGNKYGWQIPVGGSQSIADALLRYYQSLVGELQTGYWVQDIRDLPAHRVLLCDMTPKQLLQLKGLELTAGYRGRLRRYKQG